MVQPETVTRSRNLDPLDFPAPAITICSNIFARDDLASYSETHQMLSEKQNFSFSELECKYLTSNMHWCDQKGNYLVKRVCGMYDLND